MATTYWAPNQAAIPQVETYTFTAPSSVGNTYTATINGKSVTYTSIAADTAALAATGLFNLLNISSNIAPELTEIEFTNPSSGVIVATAREPGTPFANVTGTTAGLVMSTGNGLANGIATAHTTASKSPSDVNDPQNWLRVTPPAPGVRAIPQDGDDVIVANSTVPLLWNLGLLASVRFNTYTRWQNHSAPIGLPPTNPGGYTEWRETYFRFAGPAGSVPSGGLQMVLGQGAIGAGPSRERYNVGSQPTTLTILASGSPIDDYAVCFLGVATANTFTLLGGVSLGIASQPGEISSLASCNIDGAGLVNIGEGVTWTAGSTLTLYGGQAILAAAPATLILNNGAQAQVNEDLLTWATVTARGGSQLGFIAGGTITTLTLETNSFLDKSQDGRLLTITNSTLDGDTCFVNDPFNSIIFTNPTSVKQQVTSGPIRFTGTRTMRVV